jgi:hypothetical protein
MQIHDGDEQYKDEKTPVAEYQVEPVILQRGEARVVLDERRDRLRAYYMQRGKINDVQLVTVPSR